MTSGRSKFAEASNIGMNGRLQLTGRMAGVVVLLAAALALVPVLHAQGCAICYNNAAASGPQGTQALRHAILVLLIPPSTMFCGIIGLLYRRRNSSR